MFTPAREAHAAVAHHDLAVGAVVGHRAQAPADLGVVEERDLHARLMQRRHELTADALGAERVEQEAHDDALLRAFGQKVAQRGADLVGLEDVVLEVDVVLRRAHGLEDGIEGARAAREQFHIGRTRHRQPAGRGAQPRHLLQRRRRVLRRVAQAGEIGLRGCPGAAAQPLDALLAQALRPEEVIDDEARERKQRKRQDPAHRGHRRALLHHDPDRQHSDVAAPGEGEAGFPFGAEDGEDQGGEERKAARLSSSPKKKRPAANATGLCLHSRDTAEPALPGRRYRPRKGVGEATRSARSLGESPITR
jgi:hypothetical protein